MIKVQREGKEYEVKFCEHMVHHENIEGILTHGLLSHNEAVKRGLLKKDIAMEDVQNIRATKYVVHPSFDKDMKLVPGRMIHEYVPFYFNTRNPMLYRRKDIQHELVIIVLNTDVISLPDTFFSDGNAASGPTHFYQGVNNLSMVPFEVVFAASWNHEDTAVKKENVRKRCSEILVYSSVEISAIKAIVCPNDTMVNYVNAVRAKTHLAASTKHIQVIKGEGWFF